MSGTRSANAYAVREFDGRASWPERGACRTEDPEMFFAPDGETQANKHARERRANAVCAACPVMAECHDHAMKVGEVGVWAGLNEDQRKNLRKNAHRRAPR